MINVGDKIPSVKLKLMTKDGLADVSTDELFGGKKVVMFGLPGAFTPTCSAKHVPGYVANAEAIKASTASSAPRSTTPSSWARGARTRMSTTR
jgi:peroxiredoxin